MTREVIKMSQQLPQTGNNTGSRPGNTQQASLWQVGVGLVMRFKMFRG